MAEASSSWSASTSRELRSKLLAQRCRSARASIELGRDPHPVARPQHRTLHDRIDVESSSRSPASAAAAAPELHRRSARDDPKLADRREVGRQLVGHPFGEVVLAGIARVVVEREHGDRSDGSGAGAGAGAPGAIPHERRGQSGGEPQAGDAHGLSRRHRALRRNRDGRRPAPDPAGARLRQVEGQVPGSLESVFGLLLQAVPDDPVERRGDIRPDLGKLRRLVLQDRRSSSRPPCPS